MEAAARALHRLRAADGAALTDLARLMVERSTETPIAEIADPAWLAGQLATGLEALVRGEGNRERLGRALDERVAAWKAAEGKVGAHWPAELEGPLREALARPWAPSEPVVMRLLDQEVFAEVMQEVLDGTLRRFRQRLTRLDQGLLGGLGGRAARKGRGLFGSMAETMAGGVVGAVRDEVESRMDEILHEFLVGATREALKVVARHVANPAHAEAYGRTRIGLLDTLKDTEIAELAAEIEKLEPAAYLDIGLAAIRAELDADDFVGRAAARIEALLAEVGDGTLGAWLDEVGLRAVWTESTTTLIAARLADTAETPAFEAWWMGLFAAE